METRYIAPDVSKDVLSRCNRGEIMSAMLETGRQDIMDEYNRRGTPYVTVYLPGDQIIGRVSRSDSINIERTSRTYMWLKIANSPASRFVRGDKQLSTFIERNRPSVISRDIIDICESLDNFIIGLAWGP